MGFGGGSNGAFSLPDHTHTNADLNGGALVGATSLINDGVSDVTIDAYVDAKIASSTKVTNIGSYKCSSAEATTTISLSETWDDNLHSKFVVVGNMDCSSAGQQLRLQLGTYTTANQISDGALLLNSGYVGHHFGTNAYFVLGDLTATDEITQFEATIAENDGATGKEIAVRSVMSAGNQRGVMILGSFINALYSPPTIDQIIVSSGSNWGIDSTIDVFCYWR